MSTELMTFRARLRTDPGPALLAEIEQAVIARREERSGHGDWGLLCEEAGLVNLAFREFQLALRDNANDPLAGYRLAQHYRERGESERAAGLLERLLQANPAREDWLGLYVEVLREENAEPRVQAALARAVEHGLSRERAAALGHAGPGPADEPPQPGDLTPTDADCVRFQALFAGRENVHARQWAQPGGEAGYSPVQEPCTPAVIRNHLLGNYTVGVYPIRLDGTCTFFAVDLDVDRGALERARGKSQLAWALREALRSQAGRLLAVLRELGFSPLFEDSGFKGRHYWVFLEQPESAEVLHQLGRLFLGWQAPLLPHGLHIEFFPKQGERKGKGLGNLIKLPLGIHRRTGRRAVLLDEGGKALADPFAALRAVVRAPRQAVYMAIDRLKGMAVPAAAPVPAPPLVEGAAEESPPAGPAPPPPAPAWTEADFQADPRVSHLLGHCPVLGELKRTVDEHRRLSHEEQLVLIHTLGHVEGGPLAVNYLLGKCVDVGREKFMKDRLKGNPVSCPSIRKKIGHVTRRVACNCPFDFAPDRYPTPVLHLLTLPSAAPAPARPVQDLETLARRYATLSKRVEEIEREQVELRAALLDALRAAPDGQIACPGGRYQLVVKEGVEELVWEASG